MDYEGTVKALKAISDPNRLKIIEILTAGELRVCEILEYFNFSQPSLSHHLKVLWEANILNKSRDGQWITYSINEDYCKELLIKLEKLFSMD